MDEVQRRDGTLALSGGQLEWRGWGPSPDRAPTLVLLHEGLGSVDLWGAFPEELAKATGLGVFAYSRFGYGRSSPVTLPRPLDYMKDEALNVLPTVLDAIGIRRAILVGHSDGGSIAAIHGGARRDPRIAGLCLIAPHFFVEDISVRSIAQARRAYETTDLREKLARSHRDVDNAFFGWNDAWLDPAFRSWDITDHLPLIAAPVLAIQGLDDQYGTPAQIDRLVLACGAPVEAHLLPGIRHTPHREAPAATLELIKAFAERILAARTED